MFSAYQFLIYRKRLVATGQKGKKGLNTINSMAEDGSMLRQDILLRFLAFLTIDILPIPRSCLNLQSKVPKNLGLEYV